MSSLYETEIQRQTMPKTIHLVVFGIGIVFLGLVILNYAGYGFHLGSSDNVTGNYSPEYPGSSEIPLYEGDSSPDEIPNYENDVKISPIDPK